jgi:hypothetical protein
VPAPLPDAIVSPHRIVEKSIYLAHADRRQFVSVAGPDSLEAMISLCRAGFDHVECARAATCGGADDASDVLLVVGRMSTEELSAVLARTCRLLRDGGVLVVQLQRSSDDLAVRTILKARGLGVASTLFDITEARLVTHTVRRAAALRRAS